MKESMRKLIYSAVIMAVSLAPVARAQVDPQVLRRPAAPVAMPETASTAILATDLLSVGVLIFVFRRRAAGKNR